MVLAMVHYDLCCDTFCLGLLVTTRSVTLDKEKGPVPLARWGLSQVI